MARNLILKSQPMETGYEVYSGERRHRRIRAAAAMERGRQLRGHVTTCPGQNCWATEGDALASHYSNERRGGKYK